MYQGSDNSKVTFGRYWFKYYGTAKKSFFSTNSDKKNASEDNQDNFELVDGMDHITWTVIERFRQKGDQDNKIYWVLLSDYCLDCLPYNAGNNKFPWKNTTLYDWLNRDFYTFAFSDSEKECMVECDINFYLGEPQVDFTSYGLPKVSLLKKDTYTWYKSSIIAPQVTEFALTQMEKMNNSKEKAKRYLKNDYYKYKTAWWLGENVKKQTGNGEKTIQSKAYVVCNESIVESGKYVGNKNVLIRPIIVISEEEYRKNTLNHY